MNFPEIITTIETADGIAIMETEQGTGRYWLSEPVSMEAGEYGVNDEYPMFKKNHKTRELFARGSGSKMNNVMFVFLWDYAEAGTFPIFWQDIGRSKLKTELVDYNFDKIVMSK